MTRQKKPTRRKTLICDLTEECDQKDYPPKKGQPAKEGHLIKAAEGKHTSRPPVNCDKVLFSRFLFLVLTDSG